MAKGKILVDSTADLTDSARKQHNIEMIPLRVYFGEASYKDGVDMKSDRFYMELQRQMEQYAALAPVIYPQVRITAWPG